MKYLLLFFTLIFVACGTKTTYIKSDIPEPFEKIEPKEYQFSLINVNDKYYYCLTEQDALNLSNNWIHYRNYSDSNYKLLKSLRKSTK